MLPVVVLSLLLAASVTDAGVSFIRWGRTVCPSGSTSLYKGYMAGSHHLEGGSGANYLCMNEKPQFPNAIPGRQGASATITGVEFEINNPAYNGLFSMENIPGGVLTYQDVPCVRCYVEGSYDLMMMPGRQDCASSGYDLMYKGYLMAEAATTRGRAEFVCMDGAPEGIVGGQGRNSQSLIYPVEVGCGSLPCNPYVDGLEASCAICTY